MQLNSIFNLDYLVQYYAAMFYNHSSMPKVNLFKGNVAYVYWIDTVLEHYNLFIELSKRTIVLI